MQNSASSRASSALRRAGARKKSVRGAVSADVRLQIRVGRGVVEVAVRLDDIVSHCLGRGELLERSEAGDHGLHVEGMREKSGVDERRREAVGRGKAYGTTCAADCHRTAKTARKSKGNVRDIGETTIAAMVKYEPCGTSSGRTNPFCPLVISKVQWVSSYVDEP